MTRLIPTTSVRLSLGMFLTAIAASSPAGAGNDPDGHQVQITRPESSTMIIEFNSTDQDIGVQFFFDAEGWTSFNIFDPAGNVIYTTQAQGRLARLGGGSEFSLESDEPALADLSFAQFFQQFPAGTYRYIGETADGEKIYGKALFTHRIPAGPEIVTPVPQNGENCAQNVPMPVAIAWNPVTLSYFGDPIDIKGYEVVIEADDATFDVHIPASAGTSVTVTPETLHADTRYTFEVLAIETGGNQTITSGCFRTAQ
jgi:hypothetical protein